MSTFTKTVAYSYLATLTLFIVLVTCTAAVAAGTTPDNRMWTGVGPDKGIIQQCNKYLIKPQMVAGETRNGKTLELWMVPCKEF